MKKCENQGSLVEVSFASSKKHGLFMCTAKGAPNMSMAAMLRDNTTRVCLVGTLAEPSVYSQCNGCNLLVES